MVFATKMSTCPKVPERALLLCDHAGRLGTAQGNRPSHHICNDGLGGTHVRWCSRARSTNGAVDRTRSSDGRRLPRRSGRSRLAIGHDHPLQALCVPRWFGDVILASAAVSNIELKILPGMQKAVLHEGVNRIGRCVVVPNQEADIVKCVQTQVDVINCQLTGAEHTNPLINRFPTVPRARCSKQRCQLLTMLKHEVSRPS